MASPILAGVIILVLGDSHFAAQGSLGATLQDDLLAQGAQVVTEAACGAPSGVWTQNQTAPCGAAERIGHGPLRRNSVADAPVPSLDGLIAEYKPNLIVIGGGDTMAGYGQAQFPAPWIETQVNVLIRPIAAANIACVWIGPGWGTEGGPYFKTYAGVRQVSLFLSTHVAPCRYIDSTSFAQPGEWPTFDGQHYTQAGYAKWGRAISAAIVTLAQSH